VKIHTVKREDILLWLIVILAVMVRLYRLDFQSLWYDEGLQYVVSTTNSPRGMLGKISSFHPPLSFLINHYFLQIGSSDFFLRLPSALFGIGSLPLCYILAKQLTSKRVAVFTIFVLAISPLHIWYSQEGRMYSQLIFLMLLSSVVLLKALQPLKLRWWALYVLVVTAGMYTHVFMALAVIVQVLWVLMYQRRHLLTVSAIVAAVAILFLPWVLLLPWVNWFIHSISAGSIGAASSWGGRAGFSWGALPYTFFVYSAGFSIGPTVAELHADRSLGFILQFLPVVLLVGAIFGTVLATGIFAMYKHFEMKSLVLCLLGLGVPLLAVLAYSLTAKGTFNVRYTLVAFPYFCIFMGTGLDFLSRNSKLAGTVAVLGVLGISFASIHNHFTNPRYAKEDVRSAVKFWKVISEDEPLISFRGKHTTNRYLDKSDRRRHFPIGSKSVVSAINRIMSEHSISSAYVLLSRDWNQRREKAIRNAFTIESEKAFPGVKVFRIVRYQREKSVSLGNNVGIRSYAESVIRSKFKWLGTLPPGVVSARRRVTSCNPPKHVISLRANEVGCSPSKA